MEDTAAPVAATPTPSERPATVIEAFARDSASGADSQSATPATPSQPASASAETTPPPGQPQADAGNPSAQAEERGPLPYPAHERILKGVYAERDAAQKSLEEWKQYEWARKVPQDTFNRMVDIVNRANTDPVGYVLSLLDDAENHPTHAAALRSEFARRLGKTRPGAATDLSPDVEVVGPDGQVATRSFSAERVQALLARERQQVEELLSKRLGPIESEREKRAAEEKAAKQKQEMEAQLDRVEARIKKIVGNDEDGLRLVSEAILKPENAAKDPIDVALEVFEERAKSSQTKADAKALENLQKKAAASSIAPGSAVVPAKRRPTSLTDKSLQWG